MYEVGPQVIPSLRLQSRRLIPRRFRIKMPPGFNFQAHFLSLLRSHWGFALNWIVSTASSAAHRAGSEQESVDSPTAAFTGSHSATAACHLRVLMPLTGRSSSTDTIAQLILMPMMCFFLCSAHKHHFPDGHAIPETQSNSFIVHLSSDVSLWGVVLLFEKVGLRDVAWQPFFYLLGNNLLENPSESVEYDCPWPSYQH